MNPVSPATKEKLHTVGKNIPHDSAAGHVSGESVYIDDIPFSAGELIVEFWGSPVAHGEIQSLDVSAAEKIDGVIGLFTAADLKDNVFGPIIEDENLLADKIVSFVGQPVIAIAAESREACNLAKKAIKADIKELKPVFTIEDAIEANSYISVPRTIGHGDFDAAYKDAEHTLTGTFMNNGQEHFYLESQSAIALPKENDCLHILSSTQHPTEVQEVIAHVLGLAQSQVVVETKRMGGAFGGKECQATHPAAIAALVAHKTKRPARIKLSVDDDMASTGKRHAFRNHYKVGFDSDGNITALEVQLYSNGGASNDLSTAVMGRAICHAENACFIPNIRITGTVCKTNLPPNTAFRGFGGPQGMLNFENIIEDIAAYLKKDAFEIRAKNQYGQSERNFTPYGQTVENNLLPEIFERLHKDSEYDRRKAEIEEFNRTCKTHLKGIAFTPMKFGISFNTTFLNQANALVNIYRDGSVQVSTGATEMGQGVNTKIQQLVAEEFCIPPTQVRMMPTSTEKNNNTSATAASSGSDLNGGAAVNACRAIKERLLDFARHHIAEEVNQPDPSVLRLVWDESGIYADKHPIIKLTFEQLVYHAYFARVSLGERGFFATQGLSFDWEKGGGTPFKYFTTGCAVSEVLIDRFTGHLKVTRADLLMDIGRSINPGIDRGQITGAFIQGMGWLTTEELRYNDKGVLLSHSPTTYKIPNIQDTPDIFNVDWVENPDNRDNIRGSKATGEPPLMLAISVWCAVRHALQSVAGDDIVKLNAPATGEEILSRLAYYEAKACGENPPEPLRDTEIIIVE